MKRILSAIGALLFMAGAVFAQDEDVGRSLDETDVNDMNPDTAQTSMKEVVLDSFEFDGYWKGAISPDSGYISARLFPGGPSDKEPVPGETAAGATDETVLGVRVDFLRRGYTSFTLTPVRPIPVAGIAKKVSVWVVGRNFNHTLSLQLIDFYGKRYEIRFDDNGGKLNFQGWKKMTATIPHQDVGGPVQQNYHYTNQMGIRIAGLKVDCDPLDAYGTYYVYFDDLRAETDLFLEEQANRSREEGNDDMKDFW
ncbi:MAG: flagellar filament outer layer protein FlaA [Treponema sp.]|jgi:hypothetical protein|nr:flagellar filament outer layer protein FlaA [Treponema sp.]